MAPPFGLGGGDDWPLTLQRLLGRVPNPKHRRVASLCATRCSLGRSRRSTGGIGEFAEGGVGPGTVNGGRPTVHEDADTDGFGGFFFGGAGTSGGLGVRGDAAVAACYDPDGHRDEFFDFFVQCARGQRGAAHLSESAVDPGDHLPQRAVLRIEVIEYVVVVVVFVHDGHNTYTRISMLVR